MVLGIDEMDGIHREFIMLLGKAKACEGKAFIGAFEALLEHTGRHFAREEEIMRSYGYYGLQEHASEHRTLLEEMEYFLAKARKLPPLGRSYIDDYAMEKFHRHVINIDSQLAMFLKSTSVSDAVKAKPEV